jgi:putative aldouronate transport system permease protein
MTPRRKFAQEIPLFLMLAPAVVLVLVYSYAPMVGIVMAFQRVLPGKGIFGSPWVWLDNFKFVMEMPTILQVIWNTIRIAGLKAIAGVVVPVTVALMLNNVTSRLFKRTVQTVIYLPYFLSWIIMAGIIVDILSPSNGIVNHMLGLVGIKPIFFLGDDRVFPWTMVKPPWWTAHPAGSKPGTSRCRAFPEPSLCYPRSASATSSTRASTRSSTFTARWFTAPAISSIHWYTAPASSTTNTV